MLKDVSLAEEKALAGKKEAEERAAVAETRVTELQATCQELQKRFESAKSTAHTAYRILAALQEQINLERCANV